MSPDGKAERWSRLENLLREHARRPDGDHISPGDLAILCGQVETTPRLREQHSPALLAQLGETRRRVIHERYAVRWGDPEAMTPRHPDYDTACALDVVTELEMGEV